MQVWFKAVSALIASAIFVTFSASAAHAFDGNVSGYLVTFDLRSDACMDTPPYNFNCSNARKRNSNFNKLPAGLRIPNVDLKLIRSGTNTILSHCHTHEDGWFDCPYSTSSDTDAYLKVYWRDTNNWFTLTKITYSSNGTPSQVVWTTNYPQDNGRPPFRLRSSNAYFSLGEVAFYGDRASFDDMRAANIYAEAYLAFEVFDEEDVLDYFEDAAPRIIIGLDVNKRAVGDSYGICCIYANGGTLPSPPAVTKEATRNLAGILLSPDIFRGENSANGLIYLTGTVHHELGHLLQARAEIDILGYAARHWHIYREGYCEVPDNWKLEFTADQPACYTPVESFAEFIATAILHKRNSDPTAVRVRPFVNNEQIQLEQATCNCAFPPGTSIFAGMRYFWDLYDSNSESGALCKRENLTLSLRDIAIHSTLSPIANVEGSISRLVYETDNGGTCGWGSSCAAKDEAGLYDMAHYAYDFSGNIDYLDIWENNCKSRGDYSYTYRLPPWLTIVPPFLTDFEF